MYIDLLSILNKPVKLFSPRGRSPLLFALLLFSLTPTPSAQAELSYLELKDVHEQIRPEFQEQLSPLFGYVLLGTGVLENRRFYGNYGESNRGYFCSKSSSRIGQTLRENKDCPLDATSELIQRLFPSQDGNNFVANQVDSDPVSQLKPETIGRILYAISQVEKSGWVNKKESNLLKKNIQDILFEDLNPKRYLELKKIELTSKTKEHNSTLKQCGPQKAIEVQNQLDEIGKDLKSTNEKLDLNSHSAPAAAAGESATGPSHSGKAKEKDLNDFAELIIAALQESREPNATYPRFLPEQTLMAFFLKKANHKQDLVSLFKGMPRTLAHPGILEEGSQAHRDFLSATYLPTEYNPSDFHSNPNQSAQKLVMDPGLAVFSIMQDRLATKPLPPIISYATAKYFDPFTRQEVSYPDCGETSLRNFFNIILYDQKSGKFNPKHFNAIQEKGGFNLHSGLQAFYYVHSDPAFATKQQAYNDWSQSVATSHNGVDYLKGGKQCEINAGVDNMMKVIEKLLFDEVTGPTPLSQAPSRSAKLDELCKAMSRDGFILNWNNKNQAKIDAQDTRVNIEFNINGKPSFIWEFMDGHFAIKDITKKEISWRDEIGAHVVEILVHENPPTHEHHSPHLKQILPWFSSERIMNNPLISSDRQLENALYYALPLNSNEYRLNYLSKIFKKDPTQRNNYFDTIRRMISKFHPDDDYAKSAIAKLAPRDLTVKEMHALIEKVPNLPLKAHFAYHSGQFDVLKSLSLPLIKERDGNGQSLAHWAALFGRQDILKFLISQTPELMTKKDNSEYSPAHYAAMEDSVETLKFLARNAPDSMVVGDRNNKTALDSVERSFLTDEIKEEIKKEYFLGLKELNAAKTIQKIGRGWKVRREAAQRKKEAPAASPEE